MELVRNEEKHLEFQKKAKELVSKMTLEEKCSQCLNWAVAVDRLNIKAYNWWNEALHGVARAGVATVFPQAITMACSFDEDLLEEVADAISTEGRAKYNNQIKYDDTDIYKGLTFWSPNVNIFRDPRWGRGHETFGEDPFLTSRLGVRFVEGIQGHDENYLKAAACAKHFAVHSGPEDLRHEFNAEVSLQDLNETYLPAFKACVQEAKVEAVMGAYNRTNGEPCCGSKTLLTDILRKEWGFKGHVTSDCWAIKDFYKGHKVVDGPVEAVAMAMNAGCDLNCGDLYKHLQDAVEQGLVSEERIDEAVVNLYTTRMKLGLFDEKANDNPFDKISFLEADSDEMRALNLKAALKSLVLLKNENDILPLNVNEYKTIGIIGPNANNRKALVGNYEGTSSEYITALEGIQRYTEGKTRILYSEGCHLFKDRVENLGVANDRIAEVKGICEHSDLVICCMGLDAGLEGEEGDEGNAYASGDKPSLNLPGLQQQILDTVKASGKKCILVLFAGSALAINKEAADYDAIVYAGYPGARGGEALSKILFGEYSPEGKLPITFYKTTEELGDFTDYSMKNKTYRYMSQEALYPFGFGLSYSKFDMSASIKNNELSDEGIDVDIDITNVGSFDAAQTVQLYIKCEKENTPNPQLKALKKVFLKKNTSDKFSVHLSVEDFGLFNEKGIKETLPGDYTLYVGFNQPDSKSRKLTKANIIEQKIVCKKAYTFK